MTSFWIVLAVLAAIVVVVSRMNRQAREAEHAALMQRVKDAQEWVNSLQALPVVDPRGVTLQRGENCFWCGPCEWYELRTHTRRVSYRGPTVSIPITKHVRYRIGSFTPSVSTSTDITRLDGGTLFITNKRFFFEGAQKNATINFNAVARISLVPGGFEIEKQTGRSPYLRIASDAERVAAIAVRAHADFHSA